MKLLLTSAGFVTQSTTDTLLDLLGKPFADSRAVFIPTAANPERGDKSWLLKDFRTIGDLGWKELDVLDLAASSLPKELWQPALRGADVIIVGGGNTFYLSYWFQKSGFAAMLPELLKTKVYVGISAGSMVVTASLRTASPALRNLQLSDEEYGELGPKGQSSSHALGLVDFVVRPHFNSPKFPKIKDQFLREVAQTLDVPMYALDDTSAVKVVDGQPQVVSEGDWKLYRPGK